MSGFASNMSNLPPGCSVNDIEEQATGVSYAWYCSGLPKPASKAEWVTNAMRFATEKEAQAWGDDLRGRWFAMGDGEVRKTSDPVNFKLFNGQLKRLED